MDFVAPALATALLVVYGLLMDRLARWEVTAMVFTAAGVLLGPGLVGVFDIELDGESTRVLAEVTLVLVLFGDASRLDFARLRRQGAGIPRSAATMVRRRPDPCQSVLPAVDGDAGPYGDPQDHRRERCDTLGGRDAEWYKKFAGSVPWTRPDPRGPSCDAGRRRVKRCRDRTLRPPTPPVRECEALEVETTLMLPATTAGRGGP